MRRRGLRERAEFGWCCALRGERVGLWIAIVCLAHRRLWLGARSVLITPARPGYGLALIEELGSNIEYWGCFILYQYPRPGSWSRTCRLAVCRKYDWHQNKLLSRS